MAHFDEIFPKCIGFGSIESQSYDAEVFRSASGRSVAVGYLADHLREWNVSTGIHDQGDFEQFFNFWHAFRGAEDTFLFQSPIDNSSALPGQAISASDQTILAAATAGQADVQVIKTRTVGSAANSYSIYRLDTVTLTVEVNSLPVVLGVDYTESNGLLTFSPTLSLNDVVTAGYDYYLKARFGSVKFSVRLPDKSQEQFYLEGNITVIQERE